jgi:hypothetical protein
MLLMRGVFASIRIGDGDVFQAPFVFFLFRIQSQLIVIVKVINRSSRQGSELHDRKSDGSCWTCNSAICLVILIPYRVPYEYDVRMTY